MTNCPNCGAVITGPKCEYCGTVFNPNPSQYVSVYKYEAENIRIDNLVKLNELYDSALKAMRNYGRYV